MSREIQRLRDPIHGLIKFEDKLDKLAYKLIDTPEFQRLRRIKQLGFSEFTFPSATHTRFAHSIGVFHNARKLMEVVKSYEGNKFNQSRCNVILLASLLHDIGHGPFSHAFEKARENIASKNGVNGIEKHEKYSAKIIRNPNGQVYANLEDYEKGISDEIARVIEADDPIDLYHAVISSSFDADRLDYLVRDKAMSGTGAGSIDVDWLIDNLTETKINMAQDDDAQPQYISTFIFKLKGRQAAEDFLLSRYRLYTEVYLHKTTRGFEAILSRLIYIFGDSEIPVSDLNLCCDDPLIFFLRNPENIETYIELDDFSIWSAIKRAAKCKHVEAKTLSLRLINRDHLHVLDLFARCGNDDAKLLNAENDLDRYADTELGITVFKDDPSINLYSTQSGESDKIHKMVRVQDGSGNPREITDFPETIIGKNLTKKRRLVRYYFLSREKRDEATKAIWG